MDVLGKSRKLYPKKQGVFAHAAALKPPSTLLIAGGYHGNVNGKHMYIQTKLVLKYSLSKKICK